MSNSYTDFNLYNCAPTYSRMIGVYNNKGKIGFIKVPDNMRVIDQSKKYSFMAISDSHVQNVNGNDGAADLTRAVSLANSTDVSFVCHCGDTADAGTDWHLSKYKEIVDQCEKPVYAISGNHEEITGDGNIELGYESMMPYFGYPLYYSFTYGDDVFIMIGEAGYTTGPLFLDGELQFMYETLEANRNKRCFVFQHVFNFDEGDSGNPNDFYPYDLFNSGNQAAYRQKEKRCFIDLLKHYKNTVWFHGHSHALFELQSIESWANYSESLGYRSVHIPSLAKPKNANGDTVAEGSQGYIVDVYENFIVLKGRDFVQEKFLPIATYKIDTTLRSVDAGTFSDSTGIIST